MEDLHGSECFQAAIGQDARERMLKPLAHARKTVEEELAEAKTDGAPRSCC